MECSRYSSHFSNVVVGFRFVGNGSSSRRVVGGGLDGAARLVLIVICGVLCEECFTRSDLWNSILECAVALSMSQVGAMSAREPGGRTASMWAPPARSLVLFSIA